MLQFFRKYQLYFFWMITVVIVISFSFFGTYNKIPEDPHRNATAFQAIDGSLVSQSELDEMILFLSTDLEDKMIYGGEWGFNFLNDGVIKKDILQSGVAEVLAMEYLSTIAPDIKKRSESEKNYNLYIHPQAKFVSTQAIWSYFSPDMNTNFEILKRTENPLDPAAFAARVRLYLAEKRLPSHSLRQLLRSQEKQYSWLTPDESLVRQDLSLFGYHTFEDWFGPRFNRIVAEFIINTAKVAQNRGYSISKAEVLADLTQNAETSFKQNAKSNRLGVRNSQEYFNEQLRHLGMTKNNAIKIWQTVLLARRLFQDTGSAALVSPFTFSNFLQYAKESASGDLYELPKELRLGDYQTLQKFEIYLAAVGASTKEEKEKLLLPNQFLTVEEISKKNPELVQKRYLLEVTALDKTALLSKVGIRDMWNWEVDDANWNELKKQFPDLGVKTASTPKERFAILDGLNDKLRTKVDTYARSQILEAHPELIAKALEEKQPTKQVVGFSLRGPAGAPFMGVNESSIMIDLLDKAALAEEKATLKQQAIAEKLAQFSPDGEHYYRIVVLEKFPGREVLTFSEANQLGILDRLLKRTLEKHYQAIRDSKPEDFQKADKSWKDFIDVKDLVADSYFADVLKKLQNQQKEKKNLTGALAAPQRLLSQVKVLRDRLQNHPEKREQYVRQNNEEGISKGLADQWKLIKKPFSVDRTTRDEKIDSTFALNLPINEWSEVLEAPNGAFYFYQRLETSQPSDDDQLRKKEHQERIALESEMQRLLAKHFVAEFKEAGAISIDYLNNSSELVLEPK